MHCAACSAAVERVTQRLAGVRQSSVNLTTNKLTIEYDEALVTPGMIIQRVEKAGFKAMPETAKKQKEKPDENETFRREKNGIIVSLALTAVLLYISMGSMLFSAPLPGIINMQYEPINYALTQMALSIAIMIIGRRFYVSGFKALLHLNPNMDSLVAIGSTAAFVYSIAVLFTLAGNPGNVHNLYFESAAVVVALVSLGKHMEQASKQKTTGAIKKLMELAPDTAALLTDSGVQQTVGTDTLRVGDTVVVKPGEKIPLDGVVIRGESGVDESMLTGESIPAIKLPDSEVIGGTVNQNGVLFVKITRVGADTALAKIIKFVEDAQGKKAPISKTADKVAGIFVPTVIVIAIVSAAVWLALGKDTAFAVKIATAVLVIACPCAMGLATPAAIVVGTGVGAGRGILIRSGEALEITHKASVVLLDKTGTVTNGEPVVTEIIAHSMPPEQLLAAAAAAEEASQHPIAAAILERAKKENLPPQEVSEFQNISGRGISAVLPDGARVLAGNPKLMEENGISPNEYTDELNELAQKGETPMLIAIGGKVCGIISVADTVKDSSAQAIERLKKMGLRVIMLTGDNKITAEHIGSMVGVDETIAEVLPQDKASRVALLQEKGECVMMVGDGINDAPALAKADIGCAIGGGSDIAIDSADIVLMRDDLRDVARAMRLSRLTMRNIRQNLFWAFCYNAVGIPIAAGVLYPILHILLSPMIGALAMSLSSVCVITNALRLRNAKLD